MEEVLKTLKNNFDKVINHLTDELKQIRTSRATPSLIENVIVEAYGTKTVLVQLASITAPEPNTLVVQPWDKSIIKEIEKALSSSALGFNPSVDGQIIRIVIPAPTEERREELVRLLNQKLEVAKITMKNIREELLKDLKEKKNQSKISEDDYFLAQKEIQKLVDEYHRMIDEKGEDKEKNIRMI